MKLWSYGVIEIDENWEGNGHGTKYWWGRYVLCFVFHNLLEYLRFSLFIIGGGIAFYLAKKHPDVITAAFLLHSIPLDGLRFMTVGEELVIFNSLEDLHQSSSILPSMEPDFLNEFLSPCRPAQTISSQEIINWMSTLLQQPSIFQGLKMLVSQMYASILHQSKHLFTSKWWLISAQKQSHCHTRLKGKYSTFTFEPQTISKVSHNTTSCQHSSKAWNIVESLTKLAISEQWASPGKLSLYNDDLGHMSLIDSPKQLAKFYRLAQEQVLAAN